ncbi:hypothetical protein X748_18180 [Mesorhizobium sp. LNJC386A00]|nr:hypothetical protein X748_18180 [Mesorhizobium sp. LNJC386A00]
MPKTVASLAYKKAQPGQAVVIVHGMGEQRPRVR